MIAAITNHQLQLLHHTLGVQPERREPYRNHFVAGHGHHAQADLEVLEAAGLMERGRTPAFCDPDDVVFHCTEAGRVHALEHLAPPPKRSRYDEYQDSECSEGFAWWLGINVPKVEVDYGRGRKTQYRYVRRSWHGWTDLQGEWKPTKKAAKASYKEALRQRHAADRRAILKPGKARGNTVTSHENSSRGCHT